MSNSYVYPAGERRINLDVTSWLYIGVYVMSYKHQLLAGNVLRAEDAF